MAGRLGIDFGTSSTVVAVWDESEDEGRPITLGEYSQVLDQHGAEVALIPSLIHYSDDGGRWIGDQVLARNLDKHPQTFRWMKRYIGNRSPAKKRIGDAMLTHHHAGRDFLSAVLLLAGERLGVSDEEVVLTVPVESYEHYNDWLAEVAAEAGMERYRLIDEPSAALLGYGVPIQPGDVYLIFDFGGGTLDVAVILVEDAPKDGGRRCRVLGKSGAALGGVSIDQWVFQEVLTANGRSSDDEDIRPISNLLLVEARQLKERLSGHGSAELSVVNPDTGAAISASWTRAQLEDLLDEHEALTDIDRTIRRALADAAERGYREDSIKAVLMVGGSSLIPCVQKMVRRVFGRDRVSLEHPLDAVARGAAAFSAGIDFYDHIQHDYAIRHIDPKHGGYQYRPIVEHGTPYPTTEPFGRMNIKAAYDGQTQLGIAIYEVGAGSRTAGPQPMELVFDPGGAARVVELTPDEEDQRSHFWMNEDNPTFLTADPPAERGMPRFQVEFSIDGNKRLLITVRDLISGTMTHRDYPVVKLT